ncbi:Cellulose binding domain-containing protein [Micromonospora phaseoli]|uniref:Cellulose binding domain-containing protein n=1 Tax=Micromonospora phaseoli TaxID=1144548 RepID=A0A1H7CV62_9ACTN|nr:cellulose binding domain-containing protein [Micromonospora phaseoli]PZV91552.1 cellulose binding domain-containing protein [Micromonospora phaseoli]GIJ80788.1 glycosyl hydrolase family 5 [Micromonospora phaseoli]SEJ92467.1 Cellulose binding domain-containing protein [Micromonospora phaseoli]
MRRTLRAIMAVGLLATSSIAAVALGGTASADTLICDQYGSTVIQNRYVVQNNRWGTTAQQCINVTSTGFEITTQNGSSPTNGAPTAYPSVFVGCHYTNCSPGTNLPIQVSQISSATSSINYRYVSGATYNASYDIWLDPSPKRDGVNQMEIMIWFNRQGPIQPIGSAVGTANIAGRSWEVWRGNNGGNNVISYVAPSAITSLNFSVLDFINDTRNRGAITNSWYLTSIQAGFEPWQGGVGLAVTNFSAAINGGGNPTTPPPSSPPPTTPPPTGGGACAVKYTANSWNNGFTADVQITNTGSSTINGWTLAYSLPSGQQVTNTWNATLSQSGSSVTARNVGHNGTIAPGGTASFGYQGTLNGAYSSPTSFTLNGAACSRS